MKKTKILAETLRSIYCSLDRSYPNNRGGSFSKNSHTPSLKAGGNNSISTFKQNSCREQASNSSSPLWTKV
jgi:hypothetical protein